MIECLCNDIESHTPAPLVPLDQSHLISWICVCLMSNVLPASSSSSVDNVSLPPKDSAGSVRVLWDVRTDLIRENWARESMKYLDIFHILHQQVSCPIEHILLSIPLAVIVPVEAHSVAFQISSQFLLQLRFYFRNSVPTSSLNVCSSWLRLSLCPLSAFILFEVDLR